MMFSKNIVKVGKAEILNGVVESEDVLTLYFSKKDNQVYKKRVSLDGLTSVEVDIVPINASEILPIDKNFKIVRNETRMEAFNDL